MNYTVHRSFESELFENEKKMVNDTDKGLVVESGMASHFDMKLNDKENREELNNPQTSVTQTHVSVGQNEHANARICYGDSNYESYNDDGDHCNEFQQTDAADKQNEYICDTCNQGFRQKRYLIKHIALHMDDRKLYKCRFCPREVTSLHVLKNHETMHTDEKPYECIVCTQSFRTRDRLESHIKKTHCNHTHYICEVCGLSFHRVKSLQLHSAVHTGEKKYECKYCEKSFRRPDKCRSHERSQHQRLPCDKCDLIFSCRRQLKKHQMVHLDRPYKCDQCEACFTQNSNLTKHKVIHLGIKPYKCTLCGKAYAHQSNVNKHFKERHSVY